MSPRKAAWLKFVTPVAAAALVLTACGSDDGDDSADAGDDNGAVEEVDDPDDELDEDTGDDFDDDLDADDEAGGSGAYDEVADLDPVTDGVSVGDWAGPLYVDTDEEAQIWMRIDDVHVGDPSDLDIFDDSDFDGFKPVYVSLTAVNAGEVAHDQIGVSVNVVDSDGNGDNSFTYMGDTLPGDCEEQDVPTSSYLDLDVGEQGEYCRAALIGENADPAEVTYNPYYGSEDMAWTVD